MQRWKLEVRWKFVAANEKVPNFRRFPGSRRKGLEMPAPPGGYLYLADDLALSRVGYGAMQLAGPGVWGPARDPAEAVAVLRESAQLRPTPLHTRHFYAPLT